MKAAAAVLVDTPPRSPAGMLALLDYVQQFNDGGVTIAPWPGDKPEDWTSARFFWPLIDKNETEDDDYVGGLFAWALLRNVRAFLKAQAVAS